MALTKIEFAVQMTCNSCVDTIKNKLSTVEGIQDSKIYLDEQRVVIDSNLPTLQLLKILESTGKKVAVKGYAGGQAAVSILEGRNKNVQGVVRFIQPTSNVCIIDGTVDGLEQGIYQVYISETGDISEGCNNVGDIYNPIKCSGGRVYGYIGKFNSDENKRAVFRFEDSIIKVSALIGRGFVVSEVSNQISNKVACGVIARSAGLFQNPKTICACDGTTIWDEAGKKSAM